MTTCPSCGTQNASSAKFCSECGTPLVAPAGVAIEERKLVTVLFADVVGSTSLGDRFDAETLKELMGRFFAAMRDEIEAEGGTVEKFIGDAVMAAFGVPTAHEDDPARALRAALRMRRRLVALNAELTSGYGVELAIRIGINTGQVMATTSPRPGEAMATGDVVNVASRLQHLAEPGTVLVGERTAAAVRGFELAPFEHGLGVRGKAETVTAFELRGERQEPQRGIPGLRSPIVGRDRELELLGSLLRRISDERRAHLVTIYGDPGIGKSRLVREFTATSGAHVVRGRCLAYGDGITFWPFAEIAKTELGLLDTDSPEVALEKVRELGRRAPELAAAVPAIAHTIGLDDPSSPVRDLSPAAVSTEIRRAWLAFFAWLGRSGPVIAVVEDIHWADGAMLDLLEELPDRVQAPVMFLCPSRPELTARRPGWAGGKRQFSSLPLDPLGHADAAQLVRLLLDVDDLPDDLRERILERAEGNPFFLEEIVRRLIDEGLIVYEQARWKAAAGIETVEIPDTVQGVLAARIDLLPADEKRVAQAAAVVGRVFWPGAVAQLLNGDGDSARVEELLDGLERRDLVLSGLTSVMGGERELIFKHILTRDVAYESLPRRDRPVAHLRVAQWIEQTYGDRRLEVAELLAHHYDLAGERELARGYALSAAERDLDRLALDQALAMAARAADLADRTADRVTALIIAGEAHYQLADGNSAYARWREAIELLEADPEHEPTILADVCGRMAMMLTRANGLMPGLVVLPEETRRYVDLGFASAGETASETIVNLLVAEGAWAFAYRDPPPDEETLQRMHASSLRAIEVAEGLHRPDLVSIALDVELISLGWRDDVPAMVQTVERRQTLADDVHAILDLDDIYYMSAEVYWEQGRYRDALAACNEGVERVSALGGNALGSSGSAAVSRMLMGDWDAVIAEYRAITNRFGQTPPGFLRVVSAGAEYVLCSRGRFAEAEPIRELLMRTPMRLSFRALGMLVEGVPVNDALDLLSSGIVGDGVSLEWMARGRLLLAARRWDDLAAHSEATRTRGERIGWVVATPTADRWDGALAMESGDARAAAELLRASVAGYTAVGAEWDAAVSALDLAEALVAIGDRDSTAAVLATAAPALQRAGAVIELRRLDALS